MRFYFEGQKAKYKPYTFSLLEYLAVRNGHELTDNPLDCDAVLVSLCDISEIGILMQARIRHKGKKIISGGALANSAFVLMGLYSDIVNVGHGFEIFKAKSFDEMAALNSSWLGLDLPRLIKSSQKIDWESVPMVQVNKGLYQFWGAVGCKNKCSFCSTSYLNKHQTNSMARINSALSKTNKSVKVICNELDGLDFKKQKVQDFLLRDFLKAEKVGSRVVRCGIEFATETSRKANGKSIADNEIGEAVAKSKKDGCDLFLFHIFGIDSADDWNNYAKLYDYEEAIKPRIFLKFTNLEFQQGVPMYKKRHSLDLDKYFGMDFTTRLFKNINSRNKRIRVFPVKYPAYSLWRSAMSLAIDKEIAMQIYSIRNNKNKYLMHDIIQRYKSFDTDYEASGYINWRDCLI